MIMKTPKNTAVSNPFVILGKISARHDESFQLQSKFPRDENTMR